MRRLLFTILASVIFAPGVASAQFTLGPQLNWGADSSFGLGARAEYAWSFDPGTLTIGSFDYFFPKNGDWWEININIGHTIPVKTDPLGLYAGGGFNWAHVSFKNTAGNTISDNKFGLNLLAGLKYFLTNVTPYAEIRVEIGGGKQVVFSGGALFHVGSG